jgi:hypothetical protein
MKATRSKSSYPARLNSVNKKYRLAGVSTFTSMQRLIIVCFILENKIIKDFEATEKSLETDILAVIQRRSGTPIDYWFWFYKNYPHATLSIGEITNLIST